jgi:hypothetical protein
MTIGTLGRFGRHDHAIGERRLEPTVRCKAGAREASTGLLGELSGCDGVVQSCTESSKHSDGLAERAFSGDDPLGEVSPGGQGPRS